MAKAAKDILKDVLAGGAIVAIIAGGTLGVAKLIDENKKKDDEKPKTETAQVVTFELASVPELEI